MPPRPCPLTVVALQPALALLALVIDIGTQLLLLLLCRRRHRRVVAARVGDRVDSPSVAHLGKKI